MPYPACRTLPCLPCLACLAAIRHGSIDRFSSCDNPSQLPLQRTKGNRKRHATFACFHFHLRVFRLMSMKIKCYTICSTAYKTCEYIKNKTETQNKPLARQLRFICTSEVPRQIKPQTEAELEFETVPDLCTLSGTTR